MLGPGSSHMCSRPSNSLMACCLSSTAASRLQPGAVCSFGQFWLSWGAPANLKRASSLIPSPVTRSPCHGQTQAGLDSHQAVDLWAEPGQAPPLHRSHLRHLHRQTWCPQTHRSPGPTLTLGCPQWRASCKPCGALWAGRPQLWECPRPAWTQGCHQYRSAYKHDGQPNISIVFISCQVPPPPGLCPLVPPSPQARWSVQCEEVCIGEVPMPPRLECCH